MNYYEILDVETSATEHEIRTTYREWMRLVHPDRNQGNRRAEELAKRINAAYEVLSDPAKRAAYDRTAASESAGSHQSESHYDFDEATVNVSLEQVLYGGYTEFQLYGVTDLINVPKGVEDGERFVARSISGLDIKFVVHIQPHRIFRRNGPDLLMEVTVRQAQVVSEENVLISTLHGMQVSLRLRGDWQSGQQVRLQGQGLPHRNNPAQLGDLVVRVNIIPFPSGGPGAPTRSRPGTTATASGRQGARAPAFHLGSS